MVTIDGNKQFIDVTFSTNPAKKSVEEKEIAKVKEYMKNRSATAVKNDFIPMAVDSLGKWGPRMTRFFEEFVETAKARAQTPEERKSIARNYRYAREGISLAVVEAHGCYLDIMIYGKNKKAKHKNLDF